ncbi:hypothetical protein V7201_16270 [Bacillus sp. JJ1122]
MLSGLTMLASLCLLEIILAKIALGNGKNEKFSFDEFYDLPPANKR